MTIALAYDNSAQQSDLVIDGTLLATDNGLEAAVIISLFTDRRADPAEVADPIDRKGWWGDTFPDEPEDKIGSKLWLLARAKTSLDTLEKARGYASEALRWLIEDGVAESVNPITEYIIRNSRKVLLLTVEIARPETPAVKWIRTWETTIASVE